MHYASAFSALLDSCMTSSMFAPTAAQLLQTNITKYFEGSMKMFCKEHDTLSMGETTSRFYLEP